MSGHRLLVPHASSASAPLRLEGAALHHLQVLRLGPGDALEVFDGEGNSWPAEVVHMERTHAVLRLGPKQRGHKSRPISLLQALPKADKLELVLQKGTELGAHAFFPVLTERVVLRLSTASAEARLRRWQRIVEEAARQCGRLEVPTVHRVQGFLEAVRGLSPTTRVLVLDEEEKVVRLSEAARVDTEAPLALLIGPEGGLARSEVEAVKELGAVSVSLGPLVLRTETAALAALSVLRHLEGLLG